MKTELVSIKLVKSNPNNPRIIKDDKFAKLVASIKEFPKMLEIRPIVVNDDMIVLGGNMRLKACIHAGLKEVPIIKVTDLTEQEQKQFIIKDNVSGGEWDWNMLANEWDAEELDAWGLDLPVFMEEPGFDDLIGEDKNKPPVMKITFTSPEQLQKAEIEIQELLDRNYSGSYFSVSAGEI
jgi:ParB-like chromosome segregation protein Spo0J